jgi:hypothetical protein
MTLNLTNPEEKRRAESFIRCTAPAFVPDLSQTRKEVYPFEDNNFQ